IAATMRALLIGYAAGLACAAVLTTLAVASDFGARFLSTLTAMFNPLHALAGLRHRALGAVGRGPQHADRLPRRAGDAAHEWAQSRPERRALCAADPDPGGVSLDIGRIEDRLGVRLADAECRRTRVWGIIPLGWAGLVYIRRALGARHRPGLRRAAGGDRDRPSGRGGDLPGDRGAHGQALGHAEISQEQGRRKPCSSDR